MSRYSLLADAFGYPGPESLENLRAGLSGQDPGAARTAFAAFIRKIERFSLSEWEELYTRTWDLSPLAAPYVGYQIWGETTPRGHFLAEMNRALVLAGVDPKGELPDHLIPVLHYLEVSQDPLLPLMEILEPALKRMRAALQEAERDNPYLDLLEAVLASLEVQKTTP